VAIRKSLSGVDDSWRSAWVRRLTFVDAATSKAQQNNRKCATQVF